MKKWGLLIGAFWVLCASVRAQEEKDHHFEILKNLEIFNDLYRQLDLFYVDTLAADTVIEWAIHSMLQRIDPFTAYYPEEDMSDLKEMTTGKYAGVGSVIRYSRKYDRVMLLEPWEDSPATKAGLKAGDLILSIDGEDLKGMPTQDVSKRLRGEAGTAFEIQVERYGVPSPLTYKVVRENIVVPPVPYYGMLDGQVGYIFFDSFTENCSRDVRRAVIELKDAGATSLILDLRGNGGGLLVEAVEIANLFVPRGKKMVYTKGKMASVNTEYYTKKEALDTEIPLAILVDGGTASSAEIVSGALQDLDRAVILGSRTFGKGLVQVPRELPYRGMLKVTTSRYYIPSGRCIQAYDYRHLNADGSAGTLPDSLTQVFHTAGGREVRDGGGIMPDVKVEQDSLPTLLYDLSDSDVLLDYVAAYVHAHEEIAAPAEFRLSDDDYAAFVQMAVDSGFTYKRRTEEVLRVLERTARLEGCYEEAKPEFEALAAKMAADCRADMMRFREPIRRLVESTIVNRYYFRRGALEYQLRDDKAVQQAVEVLTSEERYRQILKP